MWQSLWQQRLHDAVVSAMQLERRVEPFWRPRVEPYVREPLAALLQLAINAGRRNDGLALAQERPLPNEEQHVQSIIDNLRDAMLSQHRPSELQRADNAKTHGMLRGEVIIRDDLPVKYRYGVFAQPRRFPAWVRFSSPGPGSLPDIDALGFLSIGIKLMGVPGPKLLDDERFTQDFLGISAPTFVTPDVKATAELQAQVLNDTPLRYFANPRSSHLRDLLMQSLWHETQTSPLECQYYSCVPFLLGEGQAMKYSVRPRENTRSRIPRLPLRPSDNYLREAMVTRLDKEDAEFDILLQLQTDPHRMPIENAAVRWPERLSPFVPAATLRLPRQKFDSPGQRAFASRLAYSPWHSVPEHRPLGSQNRARKRVYWELSRLRQSRGDSPHYEPTGDEVFSAEELIPQIIDRAASSVAHWVARAV